MHSLPQHYAKRPHLAFLAEASQILSRSLDPLVTIDEVARLYVPYIADLCTVDLFDGSAWRRMGAAHVDDSKREHLLRTQCSPTLRTILMEVVRTGEPVYMPNAQSEGLAPFEQLGADSLMALPLGTNARVFGVLFLSCFESRRRFSDEDFILAAEVARRAGTNIDNSRLFHEAECARAEAEAARQRSVFLTRVSDTLATSVHFQDVINQVAELAIDGLADGCLIDCTSQEETESFALMYKDQTLGSGLRELFLQERPRLPSTRDFLQSAANLLEWTHTCTLELVVRETVVGTVILFRDAARDGFSPEEVDLAEQLLRRAAGAVDRAWLFADLQKAVRVRDDFLSIASHELRTPLTALELQLGNLTRLMQKPDPLHWHKRFSDKLDRANRQTARLTKLIDNLLDVSRISAGRFRLETEDCDMARLCQDVGERWMDEAGAVGCQLSLDLERPCEGRWDPLRMEQVFTNLLSNAVKYGAGKPIHLTLRGSPTHIQVTVRDHGIGVAEDSLERIFDRFERAVSPREFCGLGLGLFITRQIVEAHGGVITVRSQLGAGSTFEVRLPRYVSMPTGADAAVNFLSEL